MFLSILRNSWYIRSKNILSGIALSPDTNENLLIPLLDYIDYILIMSVYPGKGGQKFISKTLNKMINTVKIVGSRNIKIGVDGGVNQDTINEIYNTGIDIAIVGSALFNADSINKKYLELLNE